jgi:hypothetical protein
LPLDYGAGWYTKAVRDVDANRGCYLPDADRRRCRTDGVSVRLTVSRKLNEFPSMIGVTNSVPRTARAFANNPVEIPARAPGFSRVCRGDDAMPSAIGSLSSW